MIIFLFAPYFIFSQSEEKKDAILSYLKSEGYTANVTDAGNIKFKFEGDNYYVNGGDDELYFEIFDYISNSNEGCSNRIKQIVAETDASYKTLNVYFTSDDDCAVIKFSVSSLLANKEDFKFIFKRSLNILKYGQKKMGDLYSEK